MVELKKRKRTPTISLPAELETSKYLGSLYGYAIEETNYYNVVGSGHVDGFADAAVIGKIVADKPERSWQKLELVVSC